MQLWHQPFHETVEKLRSLLILEGDELRVSMWLTWLLLVKRRWTGTVISVEVLT